MKARLKRKSGGKPLENRREGMIPAWRKTTFRQGRVTMSYTARNKKKSKTSVEKWRMMEHECEWEAETGKSRKTFQISKPIENCNNSLEIHGSCNRTSLLHLPPQIKSCVPVRMFAHQRIIMLGIGVRSALSAKRLSPTAGYSCSSYRCLSFLVQCGLEDVHSRLPTVLPVPALAPSSPSTPLPSATISHISCGLFHSAAVSSSGASLKPPTPAAHRLSVFCAAALSSISFPQVENLMTARTPGQLFCWGRSAGGRLGLGLSTSSSKTAEKMVFLPTAVQQATNVASVSAGGLHTL